MAEKDDSAALQQQIQSALGKELPVYIKGGNSKVAMGQSIDVTKGVELDMRSHAGIINYDPTELVITVRAGTSMQQLNAALDDAAQMLPFEPPELAESTIGGVLACGMSGPRRPFSGSARDYVLGMRVINGQAQDVAFGGEVMKNVAGYDVSRVQVGAWGTLGALLDVSMKVLPKPELELTLRQHCKARDIQAFSPLMRKPLPLSAAMLIGEERFIRLSGSAAAVQAAAELLGGEREEDSALWHSVRDHTHAYFQSAYRDAADSGKTLWRISVADYAPVLGLAGEWLYEWGGAQRWLTTSVSADEVFRLVAAAGGHATRYSAAATDEPAFQPLAGGMRNLQARIRDSFDPMRIFNRGRFHPELDVSPDLEATSH